MERSDGIAEEEGGKEYEDGEGTKVFLDAHHELWMFFPAMLS